MNRNYRTNTLNVEVARANLVRQMSNRARSERLRQLRRARGESIETTAARIGVSAKSYGDWERGKTEIRDRNAHLVADYFGVELAEIAEPTLPIAPVAELNGDGDEVVRLLRDIDERLRSVESLLAESLGRDVAEQVIEDAQQQTRAQRRRAK